MEHLNAPAAGRRVREPQLPDGGPLKVMSALAGLDEEHAGRGTQDCERKTWKSRPGANIGERRELGEDTEQGRRVEEQPSHDGLGFPVSSEVEPAVPSMEK
jgi:hypothetical protein